MTQNNEEIAIIHTRIADQRTHAHRLTERAELDGCRITAAEDAIAELATQIADLATSLHTQHRLTRQTRTLCDNRRDANACAFGRIQTEVEAVLEAHTASIFQLQAKLDRIAEQFAAAGFAVPKQLQGQDVADADDIDPEGDVDRTERIINAAGTDTSAATEPLRA